MKSGCFSIASSSSLPGQLFLTVVMSIILTVKSETSSKNSVNCGSDLYTSAKMVSSMRNLTVVNSFFSFGCARRRANLGLAMTLNETARNRNPRLPPVDVKRSIDPRRSCPR